jgi:hypothetical protein
LAAYKHYIELKSKARLLDVAIFGEPLNLIRSGRLIRNHKDFIYNDGTGVLKSTQDVPNRLAPWLQANLTEFVAMHSSSHLAAIVFP